MHSIRLDYLHIDTGYQTPTLDAAVVIFQQGKHVLFSLLIAADNLGPTTGCQHVCMQQVDQ